jgi:deoxyribose-phosphate aldolase
MPCQTLGHRFVFFATSWFNPFFPGSIRLMTPNELAARIDHTILKPEASSTEVHRAATEALQLGCATVCVAPVWVGRVSAMLRGERTDTRVCAVVGFPHGTSKPTVKAIEATSTIKDGADEVDVVAHLPTLLRGDVDAARAELIEIVRAARATRRDVVVKVILETALLLKALRPERGPAALSAGGTPPKVSGSTKDKNNTGVPPPRGATVEAVKILKIHADGLLVKAAGGIRDLATAKAMIEAGADRLGMSNTAVVLEQMNAGMG